MRRCFMESSESVVQTKRQYRLLGVDGVPDRDAGRFRNLLSDWCAGVDTGSKPNGGGV